MSYAVFNALIAAAPTLLRQGLLTLLREQWPQLVLTLTADATQVAELIAHRSFRFMVLDAALPGLALPGLLARIRQCPPQRLMVLANPRQLAQFRASPAGPGSLVVSNQIPPQSLITALAPWLETRTEPAPGRAPQPPTGAAGFSPRELEVLRLVVADYYNEEIANRLFLSVRTVESHRRMLLQKAGTRTFAALAAQAVREGWVA